MRKATSLSAYIEALGRGRGTRFDAKAVVCRPPQEAATRLQGNPVDLLVLDTPECLERAASALHKGEGKVLP